MKRLFYALALHGYFWTRHAVNQPFSWFLAQYDNRQANARDTHE